MTDDYGSLMNFCKKVVTQAPNAYKEANNLLNSVATKRKKCKEHFYKMKSDVDRYGHELEKHRRLQYADDISAGVEELEDSIIQRLVLGISSDRD